MEKKLWCNAKKDFLVDGSIIYRWADKLNPFRRRAIDEGEVFDLIVQEHQTNSIHVGKNKTFAALNQQFFSIRRQEVTSVLKHCRTCAQTKSQTSRTARAPLKPINIGVWIHANWPDRYKNNPRWRIQVDFAHYWPLFKFSSSFALRSKHAVEVSEKLALWIGLFGPPHIFQCDNGTEFKDTVLLLLKKYGIKVLCSCFKSGNDCDMWCHVKSTTCTNLNLPHTTETTSTNTTETTGTNTTETIGTTGTAMTGQCCQPQAPLTKRLGTSSLRRVIRQVASAPSLTARATSASGTTSPRRHTRQIMESSPEPDSDDALPTRTYHELLEAFR